MFFTVGKIVCIIQMHSIQIMLHVDSFAFHTVLRDACEDVTDFPYHVDGSDVFPTSGRALIENENTD